VLACLASCFSWPPWGRCWVSRCASAGVHLQNRWTSTSTVPLPPFSLFPQADEASALRQRAQCAGVAQAAT
jgi:hypothetical protein